MSRPAAKAGRPIGALAKAGALLSVPVLALTAYLVSARPAQLPWGVTDLEVRRAMPGDSLNPHPAFLATCAITNRGTPAKPIEQLRLRKRALRRSRSAFGYS